MPSAFPAQPFTSSSEQIAFRSLRLGDARLFPWRRYRPSFAHQQMVRQRCSEALARLRASATEGDHLQRTPRRAKPCVCNQQSEIV